MKCSPPVEQGETEAASPPFPGVAAIHLRRKAPAA